MERYQAIQHICFCGVRFTIPPGEQKFLAERKLSLPKRCKPCREKKKAGVADIRDIQERSPFKDIQREIFEELRH